MNACPQHRIQIALLAAGVLELSARRHLEDHVATCPVCRDSLAELRDIGRQHAAAMSSIPPVKVSPDFHQRLLGRLQAGDSGAKHRRSGWLPAWLAAYRWQIALPVGLAVVAGLALILGQLRNPVIEPPPRAIPQPAVLVHEPKVDAEAPATLLAYRRAARQSNDAFDALLAHQAALSPGPDYPVNAFTRDLPALTD